MAKILEGIYYEPYVLKKKKKQKQFELNFISIGYGVILPGLTHISL